MREARRFRPARHVRFRSRSSFHSDFPPRLFHPSLPPTCVHGGHIFPTTSAKVFISSGNDVRDGKAPLFTARSLARARRTSTLSPPAAINSLRQSNRSVSRSRAMREHKRNKKKEMGECEYVYVSRDKSLLPESRRAIHRCITIVPSFLLSPSPPLPVFFNPRFSSPRKVTSNIEGW